MTAKEKISFMIEEVRELARLNAVNSILSLRLEPVYFHEDESLRYIPDDAPLQFSVANQIDVLNKFKADGLISNLDVDSENRVAYFCIDKLDIDSDDNPYALSKSGTVLPAPAEQKETDLEKGILTLKTGQTVFVTALSGKENNALRLLLTLMKEPDREWNEDEILQDWEGANCFMNEKLSERIYQSHRALAKKVFDTTEIDDFIRLRNKNYQLNTKYLKL